MPKLQTDVAASVLRWLVWFVSSGEIIITVASTQRLISRFSFFFFFFLIRNLHLIKIRKLPLVSCFGWDTGHMWGWQGGGGLLFCRGLLDEFECFSLFSVSWWTFSSNRSLSVCSKITSKPGCRGKTLDYREGTSRSWPHNLHKDNKQDLQ